MGTEKTAATADRRKGKNVIRTNRTIDTAPNAGLRILASKDRPSFINKQQPHTSPAHQLNARIQRLQLREIRRLFGPLLKSRLRHPSLTKSQQWHIAELGEGVLRDSKKHQILKTPILYPIFDINSSFLAKITFFCG